MTENLNCKITSQIKEMKIGIYASLKKKKLIICTDSEKDVGEDAPDAVCSIKKGSLAAPPFRLMRMTN